MDFQPLEHDHNLFCFQSWAVCGLLLCKETSAHEDGSVGMWLHTSTLHVCHICLHWGRWHHCDLGFIPRSPLDLLLWWITAAATRSLWALPLTCIGSCSPATLEPKTPVHFFFSLAHPKVQALPRNNHFNTGFFLQLPWPGRLPSIPERYLSEPLTRSCREREALAFVLQLLRFEFQACPTWPSWNCRFRGRHSPSRDIQAESSD